VSEKKEITLCVTRDAGRHHEVLHKGWRRQSWLIIVVVGGGGGGCGCGDDGGGGGGDGGGDASRTTSIIEHYYVRASGYGKKIMVNETIISAGCSNKTHSGHPPWSATMSLRVMTMISLPLSLKIAAAFCPGLAWLRCHPPLNSSCRPISLCRPHALRMMRPPKCARKWQRRQRRRQPVAAACGFWVQP